MSVRLKLALILLLALALRLALWSQPLHQLANDENEYVAVARDLAAGRGWVFYERYDWLRAPLYPLFLAGSLRLSGGDLHAAALPNILLSVATVYLAWRLARAMVGERAALLAALLTAVLWTLATFASLYMSETLFTFLFTAGLLALLHARRALDAGRRAWPRVALAGALFGLAALTRSAVLPFLPLAALWLAARTADDRRRTANGSRLVSIVRHPSSAIHRLPSAAGLLLAAALTIAPWTIRNYVAYGRPILIETGLSFNLWFFSDPHESRDEIYQALRSISNPAERADYATARGLARLREDPSLLVRRLLPNWFALWRVKPIEDRFLQESYYADVSLPIFVGALIFDDLLYLIILLAALAGLVRWRPPPGAPDPRWLAIGWLACVIVTTLLTHGEGRYRHFIFPVLIPYAAWALHTLLLRMSGSAGFASERAERLAYGAETRRAASSAAPLIMPQALLILALWLLAGYSVLAYYPWRWAQNNVGRGWHTLVGDLAWAAGDRAAGLRAYERAVAYGTPDAWLRLGDAARALGDTDRALAAYRQADRITLSYVAAHGHLGDLLRALGDREGARQAFDGAPQQRLTDWAWRELRPPPASALDIGDGVDYGYVGGMYAPEEIGGVTARWTNGRGMLHLAAPAGAETRAVLRLRMAAPWPDGRPVPVQVCWSGACRRLDVRPAWRSYQVMLPLPAGAPPIEVRSPTFAAADGRALGVLLAAASVVGE